MTLYEKKPQPVEFDANEPLPEHPWQPLSMSSRQHGVIDEEGVGTYQYSDYWGVITPNNSRGDQGLVSIDGVFASTNRVLPLFFRAVPPSFEVGKVYGKHSWPRSNTSEAVHDHTYIRVAAADIVGWAGKKSPSKLRQFLADLLPQPAQQLAPIREK